ncbi:antitoxin VbhA family protein [uncultured Megamonas sp.]|uniref:antitoxin VbhA family protein n=1 Tax=uncultured Megamonas sp. TaxID=286140 RepID=UPI002670AC2B|nr:antitoxin VbhA family protein [uncultured Megamonas sp.]
MINKELAENVASAIKSCELEGFIYTKDEQKIFAKIASGEISTSEARELFKRMF